MQRAEIAERGGMPGGHAYPWVLVHGDEDLEALLGIVGLGAGLFPTLLILSFRALVCLVSLRGLDCRLGARLGTRVLLIRLGFCRIRLGRACGQGNCRVV
jgi:hypothetical protein